MENLTEQQIAAYREAFCYYDRDHDGKISTSDLGLVMRSLGKCVTKRQLREASKNFESGFVDFAEFLVLMQTIPNIVDTSEQIIECFEAFDRKKTGFIALDKLKEILMTLGEELSEEEVDNMIKKYCTVEDDEKIEYAPLAEKLVAAIAVQ